MTNPIVPDSLPTVGMKLRDKWRFTHNLHGKRTTPMIFTVADVFKTNGTHPGMILEWRTDYNPNTGKPGKHGQAFTTKDWQDRWEVAR